MKFNFFIIFVFLSCLNFSTALCENTWTSDDTIVSGLSAQGILSKPIVVHDFPNNGDITLISGSNAGIWHSYAWNTASQTWIQDDTLTDGLVDRDNSNSAVAYNLTGDNTWILVQGWSSGNSYYDAYKYNGTSWVLNATVESGLSIYSAYPAPDILTNFPNDGNFSLITGSFLGTYRGWIWNSTTMSWVQNDTIIAGISSTGDSQPVGFYNTKTTRWELIVGNKGGQFPSYYWNGTSWVSDSTISTGLGDIGSDASPTIYSTILNKGRLEFITGLNSGAFSGFYIDNNVPTTSSLKTESQTNPTQIITNTSSPYFTWSYSDADNDPQYSYQIYVGTSLGASDMWNSGAVVSTATSDNYAGTDLEEKVTYYIQVRTNDGYEDSSWLTGTFELKDTTAYSPPPSNPPSGGKSDIEIISEKLGGTEVITEKITEVLTETDSMIFVLYLLAAILGALVFAGFLATDDTIFDIALAGTIAWICTLLLMFVNNLFEFFVADTVLMMLIAVVLGLVVYAGYDFWKGESKSKTKPTRRTPR